MKFVYFLVFVTTFVVTTHCSASDNTVRDFEPTYYRSGGDNGFPIAASAIGFSLIFISAGISALMAPCNHIPTLSSSYMQGTMDRRSSILDNLPIGPGPIILPLNVRDAQSGKCMDSRGSGSGIEMRDCDNNNQEWFFRYTGDSVTVGGMSYPTFVIRTNSGSCLSVTGAGHSLQQYNCEWDSSSFRPRQQQWYSRRNPSNSDSHSGPFTMFSVAAGGRCLSVNGFGSGNGHLFAGIQQECNRSMWTSYDQTGGCTFGCP